MSSACHHQSEAGAERAGLSRFAAARIAVVRAERKAFDEARATAERANRRGRLPSLEVAPFNHRAKLTFADGAKRGAAEAVAMVGILSFVIVTLVAVALLGDAPGMSTALAAAGG